MKTVIITSLISMLLNPVNNPVNFQYPHNIISTPYGTCTWYYSLGGLGDSNLGSIFQGMTFGSDINMTVVNYTFNGQATGTFDLPVYDSVLLNYDLFVQGGMLISVPDLNNDNSPDALRFRVKDSKQFTCLIIHKNWTQPAVIGLELRNQNITIGDTVESNVEEIMSYTSSINGYAQTINSNTNTIKNILTQSLGSYVSQNGSLYTDMQTLINVFKSVDSKIDNLNDINFIDIDTNIGVTYNYIDFNYNSGSYSNSAFISTNKLQSRILTDGHIIRCRLQTYLYSNNNNIQLYVVDYAGGPNTTNISAYKLYTVQTRWYTDIYFLITGNNPNPAGEMYLAFLMPGNFYFYGNPKSTISYLDDSCQDYWNVLKFIYEQNNSKTIIQSIKDVETAIKNMSLNVNQLTVNATGITYNTNQTQVDNSVTSYQNNISVVNNIENNFKTMFDNANQNYNIDNIPITNDMINTNNFMNNIASQLYGIDIIKYPVTLLLLGIVLIGLLG